MKSPVNRPAAPVQRLVRGLVFVLVGAVAAASALLGAAPASAAAPATSRVADCSWDHPGVNPFMGDIVSAVDRYTDIPADVRGRLKQRMAKRQYDEIAVIKRDSIEGQGTYDATIRDMHFGTDRVCTSVSRKAWSASQQERGLVYCEGNQCLIVPTVCRNLSRITRKSPGAVAGAGLDPAGAPGDELLFAPPGAGPMAQPAAVPEGGPVGNAPFASGEPGSFASGSSAGAAPFSPAFASVGGAPAGGYATNLASSPVATTTTVLPSNERSPSLFSPAVLSAAPVVIDAPVTTAPITISPIVAPPVVTDTPVITPPPVVTEPPVVSQPPGISEPPPADNPAVPAVPEPGTWALMLVGLMGCCALRGRAVAKSVRR